MAATRILLAIICLIVTGSGGLYGGSMLGNELNEKQRRKREKFIKIVREEIGTREKSGKNDGERVEAYLNYVGFKKGQPYCAAFVSFVFWKTGYGQPRTAWSPALFPESKRARDALPGDVLGIYFPSLKRIGHCGIVEKKSGDWVFSIEGNTNVAGSREGDGVYRKIRHVRTIRYYANWIQ